MICHFLMYIVLPPRGVLGNYIWIPALLISCTNFMCYHEHGLPFLFHLSHHILSKHMEIIWKRFFISKNCSLIIEIYLTGNIWIFKCSVSILTAVWKNIFNLDVVFAHLGKILTHWSPKYIKWILKEPAILDSKSPKFLGI